MTTEHDHDDEVAGDLAVPDAVAERTSGGDTKPALNATTNLKTGITQDASVHEWRSQP